MNKARGREILVRLIDNPQYEQALAVAMEKALASEEFAAVSEEDIEILRIGVSDAGLRMVLEQNMAANGYHQVPTNDPDLRCFVLLHAYVCQSCGAANTFAMTGPCLHCGAKFPTESFKENWNMVRRAEVQGPRVIQLVSVAEEADQARSAKA